MSSNRPGSYCTVMVIQFSSRTHFFNLKSEMSTIITIIHDIKHHNDVYGANETHKTQISTFEMCSVKI